MKFFALILISLAIIASSQAEVRVLDDETFNAFVGMDRAALVKFYAPWCGHCKALAPKYEEASELLKDEKRVVIAEIDCDKEANKKICSQYGVTGYPTLKWFPKGSRTPEDFTGARTAEAIVEFAQEKVNEKKLKSSPVTILDIGNFEAKMKEGKAAFVKFFAPWCGHCKRLAPIWGKLVGTFEGEPVTIAEVDCDDDLNKPLCGKYGIKGFPTLMFFTPGAEEPVKYEGGREGDDLTTYVNEQIGTFREFGGAMSDESGTVPAVAELVQKFVEEKDAEKKKALIKTITETTEDIPLAQKSDLVILGKLMSRVVAKGDDWTKTEISRLERMLEGTLTAKKSIEFQKRVNALKTLI